LRPFLLCFAILLVPPCAALAQPGAAIAEDVTAHAGPVLDLSFDPAVAAMPDGDPLATSAAVAPAPAATDGDRPFSLGVKIKSRPDLRSPAARAAAADSDEPPTLVDKVEGLVERSAIGVTGTYRF
jgi:hypothetical protein